ncbi:MAG: peptidylprolyl isomerase [Bacteroidia bacterium]
MQKLSYIFFILCFALACGEEKSSSIHVKVVTDLGDIMLELYDETPVHRDNFKTLVESGVFDGMYFHRIVPGFIVQAGEPATRPDKGQGIDVNYTLPAEITGEYIHLEGKLAAARQPDEKNPEWRSSGSQFYIVTGSNVEPEDLDEVEKRMNMRSRSKLYDEFLAYEQDPYNPIDFDMFLGYKNYEDQKYYTPQMRSAYTRKRGAPNLDFQYTIFGAVLLGMDVVRALDQVPVKGEQPLRQVRIRSMEIVE